MMRYSEGFKRRMVERMVGPEGLNAGLLSEEVGVHQTTLSRWLREAAKVGGMTKTKKKAKRPKDWTTTEKFELVSAASKLEPEQLGSFLREHGVHRTHLETWRQQMLAGLEERRRNTKKRSAEGRRIRELEGELRRKEKALAEAAALLVLKKKAQAIWGDEDDATAPRRGS